MLKVPTFLSFPKPFSLPLPNKNVYQRQIWIFFWLSIQFWEKFLSPMDLTQCARFRILPSFQSVVGLWGAHTALCTSKSMWSDRSSQRLLVCWWQGRLVAVWTNPSHSSTLEDTIVTGVRTLDWKSSDLAIKPTQFELQWLDKARGPKFEIARFSNKEKNPALVALDRWG